MSVFNKTRLLKETFQVDSDRLRRGWYSDAYFINTVKILDVLSKESYKFKGESLIPDAAEVNNGNIIVEMQFFTRRKPFSLVAGVDEALAILEDCTGYFDEDGNFVNTYSQLEIDAAQDGTFVNYEGDSLKVQPVLRVRGRYRDFAILETPILGALTGATRVATNVYNVLIATGGKDVLFFPARFAHYKVQALHGYAYSIAVQAYNFKYQKNAKALVSTDVQGEWWGAKGGGTISHASIACFLGDTAETMMQFARIMPIDIARIALVDFHNDCVGTTLKVMSRMYERYLYHQSKGEFEEALKYKLYGVRPDTSGNMRDVSVPPLGDKELDCGVNPRLVWALREAIDHAWQSWDFGTDEEKQQAVNYCQGIKIIATGGFNSERIKRFEELKVPVDVYGVGSSLIENSSGNGTSNDYTADIVKVKVGSRWEPVSKVGRSASDNPNLEKIQ